MLVVAPTYEKNCIVFLHQVKNNIIDGFFTRILYVTPCITMKGVYLLFPLCDYSIETSLRKHIYHYDPVTNRELVDTMIEVERDILSKYKTTKYPKYVVKEQLEQNQIKLHPGDTSTLILKISGIWETSTYYGLAYKYMKS
jgi:hypothetical protein